jgi:hypothetical protein
VLGVGRIEDDGALVADVFGAAVMDVGWRVEPDPEWRCSSLYQPKNRLQKA